MLIIDCWYGRLGNNILQILRAIHFAKINNHSIIKFNNHSYFTSNIINISSLEDNKTIIRDTFFNLRKFKLEQIRDIVLREYFQSYVQPIFKIKNNENYEDNETVYIHIRGGDVFNSNPNKLYVQPPLIFYKNIISNYKYVKLICEDTSNPCVNELLRITKVKNVSGTLNNDLELLCNARNIIVGFGSFGLIPYFANNKLENMYIPKYAINSFGLGMGLDKGLRINYDLESRNNLKLHIIELPNYIEIGHWKNTELQRNIMINYSLK